MHLQTWLQSGAGAIPGDLVPYLSLQARTSDYLNSDINHKATDVGRIRATRMHRHTPAEERKMIMGAFFLHSGHWSMSATKHPGHTPHVKQQSEEDTSRSTLWHFGTRHLAGLFRPTPYISRIARRSLKYSAWRSHRISEWHDTDNFLF